MQLQKEAVAFARAYSAQQYHGLLGAFLSAFELQHTCYERCCVRLLVMQPMWRQLQVIHHYIKGEMGVTHFLLERGKWGIVRVAFLMWHFF